VSAQVDDIRDVTADCARAFAVSQKLKTLENRIRSCRICRLSPLGQPLPHEPRPVLQVSTTARLAICGQAPGTRVHASGRPFTDPSGDRLRAWIGLPSDVFYDATRVAIIPMGFCFPGLDAKGGDLPPRKECASTWHADLFATLPQIELILLVGQHAQRWHLGAAWRNNGWLRQHPWFETDLLPVLRETVKAAVSN
jgi:uracil-DNA glycosylase